MRKFDPPREGFLPAQTVALLKNACREKLIDERRHNGVLRTLPLEDAGSYGDRASESPAEVAEEREAVAMGQEAISSLSERDRAVFCQRHQLELTLEEILARNPGLSRRTYRKIMQRANARALRAFEEIGSGARCEEMQRECLRRYAAGDAAAAELGAVESHLRHCRSCRLAVARMRGHLHEVASGLVLALAGGRLRGGLFTAAAARLLDGVEQGAQTLAETTRAIRERLRELALRAATTLPGSGGETAAGQIVGAKALSACAVGTIAAGCLAAGLVPGVGGLELLEHQGHRSSPKHSGSAQPRASRVAPASIEAPPSAPSSSPSRSGRMKAPGAAAQRRDRPSRLRPTRALPRTYAEPSAPPRISGSHTGEEFGGEAEGTYNPVPSVTSNPSSEGGSSAGGDASLPRDAAGSGRESKPAPEFGF